MNEFNTNEMDDIWVKDFIRLVQNEVNEYKQLLDKLQAQQYAIIDRDVLRITEMAQESEESVERAKKATEKRNEKLQDVNTKIRPSKELNSLEHVIPIVGQQYSERLKELKEQLETILHKIKESNKTNRYLVQQSLDFVNKNIELFTKEAHREKYGNNGKLDTPDKSTVFKLA